MAPVSEGKFDRVCLGGTFDNLHDGHKRLLAEAIKVTKSRLIIGVTDESMVKNKVLWELIKPVEERINNLRSYLVSLSIPDIVYDIVPISDPFGPSIEDPSIGCIVVSQETIRGGQKINQIRKEKGMEELEIVTIDLIPETMKESDNEDDKISSSSARIRMLGRLIKEPGSDRLPYQPNEPYLIGITGGIASGKSSIANILESNGAGIINCDLIAHQSYEPGSGAYNQLIESFGSEIVDQGNDKRINRTVLGSKVFSSPDLLSKLESIVWPATKILVDKQINRFKNEQKPVIVVEASQLIEANWTKSVNQVWVTFIPESEAIKRLYERNKLSEDEARKRISVQMSNVDRIKHANVLFSTLWEREFTKLQVMRAWKMLSERFLRKM